MLKFNPITERLGRRSDNTFVIDTYFSPFDGHPYLVQCDDNSLHRVRYNKDSNTFVIEATGENLLVSDVVGYADSPDLLKEAGSDYRPVRMFLVTKIERTDNDLVHGEVTSYLIESLDIKLIISPILMFKALCDQLQKVKPENRPDCYYRVDEIQSIDQVDEDTIETAFTDARAFFEYTGVDNPLHRVQLGLAV